MRPAFYQRGRTGPSLLRWIPVVYDLSAAVITIAGVDRTRQDRKRNGPMVIHDVIDEAPNTIEFTCWGFTPRVGNAVVAAAGTVSEATFVGNIINTVQIYESRDRSRVAFRCRAQDHSWLVARLKVNKKYTSQTGTAIAQDLVATFASAFSVTNIEAGLPTINDIEFVEEDFNSALTRLAKLCGAYYKADDLSVYLYTVDTGTQPAALDETRTEPFWDLEIEEDLTQVRTRVLCAGGGSSTPVDVAIGATTIPVQDGSWYLSSGGKVQVGGQRLTYSGRQLGGTPTTSAGKLLAPSAPSGSQSSGVAGNVDPATYNYAMTAVTADGESELSSVGSVTVAGVTAPTDSITATAATVAGGGLVSNGVTYLYGVSYLYPDGESAVTSQSSGWSASGGSPLNATNITGIPTSADGRVTGRRIYRSRGGSKQLVVEISDNTTTAFTDVIADASLGGVAPAGATGGAGRVALTVPVGPAGTTRRNVWRSTVASSSVRKFLGSINDNSTTSLTDNSADTSLGIDAPTASQIGAVVGDTSLNLASTSGYPSAGWLKVGSQWLRYTGTASGPTRVTGIPSTGTGSIAAKVPFNTTVSIAPQITGVPSSSTGSIAVALAQGVVVSVLTQSDDATAQAALGTLIGGTSADGIVEHFISDSTLSAAAALARGAVDLALFKNPVIALRFKTRDVNMKSGKTLSVNLSSPQSLVGSFKVMDVTITDLERAVATNPVRSVVASSVKFSLEDLLRRALVGA